MSQRSSQGNRQKPHPETRRDATPGYYLMVERGKKSSAEYKAIAPRIRKFFQDKS